MDITEIRVKLMGGGGDKLKGFCSVTFADEFVVRDLKIIEGAGGLFVAMPSRKLADRCRRCGGKNHLRASYCNECGTRLRPDRAVTDERGRARLHADIAHPINSRCRDFVQGRVIAAYSRELDRAAQEGYVPTTFEDLDYDYDVDADYVREAEQRREQPARRQGGTETSQGG